MLSAMRLQPRRVVISIGGCLFLITLYCFYMAHQTSTPLMDSLFKNYRKHVKYSNFVVDTPSCSIPNVDPFDEQIAPFVWRTAGIDCTKKQKPSITFQDGIYLRINRVVVKMFYDNALSYCEYEPIVRPDNTSDDVVSYTNTRHRFYEDFKVSHQFMRVYCYSSSDGVLYSNFHAFILPNAAADARFNTFKHHVTDDGLLETFNVVMVGLDSVSRLNSMRQLPRVRKYLLKELGGIELAGYNKVADNTFVNIVPMTVGKFVDELPWNERISHLPFDKHNFMWKRFKEKGFRTLYAEDAPKISIFNYLKTGFHTAPTDYYLRPFSLAMEKHKSLWHDDENCVGDRLETEIVLDWVKDFILSSERKPHFSFTFITRLTHNDVNTAGAADEPHLKFLKSIHASGVLDNTVLFYFGDHGMRFGDIRTTYIGKLEDRLPMMTIVLPKWFHKKYPKLSANLNTNAHRLSTPFDIHETLVDLLYFNSSVGRRNSTLKKRGYSLFDVIPDTRTCSDASILPHWCSCQKHESVPHDHKIVQEGAKAAINYINSATSKHRNLCAELSLQSVKESWRSIPTDDVLRFEKSQNDVIDRHVVYGERSHAIVDYQMFIVTSPNNAIFEVSVRHNEKSNSIPIVGEIVRISEIGDESVCISVHRLKQFCYCTYL